MVITKSLKIDLVDRVVLAPIHAVQCDSNTRAVAVTLTAGGVAWEPPADAAISVAFKKPDGKKGWYDKLPDGSNACSVSGNVVTAILAPEALTVAGKVDAVIVFQDKNLNQLATFGFAILVEPNPAAGREISNDYYNYSNMEAVNQAMEDFFVQAEADYEAFTQKVETEQAAFLETAGEALAAVHEAATADAPAIVCEASGELIAVSDASGRMLQGLRVFGRTTQDGTPSPDNPVPLVSAGDSGSVEITVAGKNLVPFTEPSATLYGVTFKNNKDGSWILSGTATVDTSFLIFTLPVQKGVQYVLSGCPKGGSKATYYLRAINQSVGVNTFDYGDGASFIPTSDGTVNIRIYIIGGQVYNTAFYPMVEIGETKTAFEPYKPAQTLTFSTPNGLHGIPVSSGGNYTDADGQRICDYVDAARGKRVQRLIEITLNGTESWQKNYNADANNYLYYFNRTDIGGDSSCCDKLQRKDVGTCLLKNGVSADYVGYCVDSARHVIYINVNTIMAENTVDCLKSILSNNPVTVLYPLAIPVETDLTAEEIAQYSALHTNYPNTTVYNDAGAGMEMEYVADTKLYIDNKIAAVAAAVLNNT